MALTEKLQILITADGRAAQAEFNKVGKSAEQSLGKTDDRLQRSTPAQRLLSSASPLASPAKGLPIFLLT